MTSSWFFLSTMNYDARSTTHQLNIVIYARNFMYFVSQILNLFFNPSVRIYRHLCVPSLETFVRNFGAAQYCAWWRYEIWHFYKHKVDKLEINTFTLHGERQTRARKSKDRRSGTVHLYISRKRWMRGGSALFNDTLSTVGNIQHGKTRKGN